MLQYVYKDCVGFRFRVELNPKPKPLLTVGVECSIGRGNAGHCGKTIRGGGVNEMMMMMESSNVRP